MHWNIYTHWVGSVISTSFSFFGPSSAALVAFKASFSALALAFSASLALLFSSLLEMVSPVYIVVK
jgi:hypothetical protein